MSHSIPFLESISVFMSPPLILSMSDPLAHSHTHTSCVVLISFLFRELEDPA